MINSFKSYLVEEEKTLYFVWGRMNPPTAGHEKLLDFLKAKAGNNPYRIYLTQSEDQTKNPIPYMQKIKFARKGFPQYARQIMMDRKLKTIFDAVTSFYNEGFKRIVVVAGGDRIRQTISLVEGIEQDISKKITSEIKSSKMKIQAKINGNELRIDGKKRDDLQSAMQLIEDLKIGIPVQFINFRD